MNEKKFDDALREIINKELEPHNLTIDDVMKSETWYSDLTMTPEQSDEWVKFGVELLRKKLRLSKKRAEREMVWVNIMWGLRVV